MVLGWQDRSGPTGRGTRVFLHRSCSLVSVLCCVTFHLLCGLTKYTIVGIALGPTLTVHMPAIGPGDSLVLFLPGHWHRSTEVWFQDFSSCTPRPTVGAIGAVQSVAWSNLHVYLPTRPTAAKARPTRATRKITVLLDVCWHSI